MCQWGSIRKHLVRCRRSSHFRIHVYIYDCIPRPARHSYNFIGKERDSESGLEYLDGYTARTGRKPNLTLDSLEKQFHTFLLQLYHWSHQNFSLTVQKNRSMRLDLEAGLMSRTQDGSLGPLPPAPDALIESPTAVGVRTTSALGPTPAILGRMHADLESR